MILLPFFTDPYPDELLYSAIARYHFYSGNRDYKDTLEELFDNRSVIPNLEIGTHLSALTKNLGNSYSVEDILNKHTIYPYYSPFLTIKRQNEILKDIEGNGEALYVRLGLAAGSICKKDGLYYCYKCAIEDQRNYGEPYIHREHNLQGINYCAHHSIKLKRYNVELSHKSRLEYIRFETKYMELNENSENVLTKEQDEYIEILLSKLAYRLLQIPIGSLYKDSIRSTYKELLKEKRLLTKSSRIRQTELYLEMGKILPGDLLKSLESELYESDEYNWPKVITRNIKRNVHPLRHLLFMYFLGIDNQNIELFLSDYEYKPFGSGPWPCLNRVAEHYLKDVVGEINISQADDTGNVLGTFKCKCGFIYTRRGPDTEEQDRYKKDFVKEFGESWVLKVKELSKKGLTNSAIAKLLEVDWKTIDRYLKTDLEGSNNYETRFKFKGNINEYKNNLLEGIKENPNLTRTQIRAIYSKEYAYLYEYDKKWLMANLTKKVKVSLDNKRVDWQVRDQQYLDMIQQEYEYLIALYPPVRITKSIIGKRLRILSNLENKLDKLPQTEAYLVSIIESVQEFQYRKCLIAIDLLIINEEVVTIRSIREKVKMREKHFELIRKDVEEYIRKIQLEAENTQS